MHLELTDEQTEALIRELSQLIDGDRYPLSPRIRVLKEIFWDDAAGPRSPGTAAPTTALRAAEQGTVCTATRLGGSCSVRVAMTPQERYCTLWAVAVILAFVAFAFYLDPTGLWQLNPFGAGRSELLRRSRLRWRLAWLCAPRR
jgi:hypothetical protein